METLQVALGRRSYPIYIGGGLLEQAEELLRPLGVGRWAIVCDDTVAALYGAPLARRTGWPLATFPAGEGSKSLEEYDRLCRRLVQLGLTRSDGILALGGGVTGDLAGFAAATVRDVNDVEVRLAQSHPGDNIQEPHFVIEIEPIFLPWTVEETAADR